MTCSECDNDDFVRVAGGIDACGQCVLRARADWCAHEAELERQAYAEGARAARTERKAAA